MSAMSAGVSRGTKPKTVGACAPRGAGPWHGGAMCPGIGWTTPPRSRWKSRASPAARCRDPAPA
eukprot:16435453-Heterocapsa_arctica.AAC.1